MDDVDKTMISAGHVITVEELAGKLAADPDGWVLFLGRCISAGRAKDYRKILSDLARQVLCEAAPDAPMAKEIRQAVQDRRPERLAGALFGSTWDGASFLDEDRKRDIRLRGAYAESLCSKNEIDVHKANVDLHLQEIVGKFNGTILTTCQDDTVEAFWEYEHSLPADTIVYTPQRIADSNEWSRWLRATQEDAAYLRSQNGAQEDAAILVKLFGTRDEPAKMLLSKQDMEDVYPPKATREKDHCAEEGSSNTISFLEKVFDQKNILFVGVDFEDEWLLKAAEGILELLEKKPSAGVERYAISSQGVEAKRYHIQALDGVREADRSILKKLSEHMQDGQMDPMDSHEERIVEAAPLQSQEEILRLFWLFYNRHPQKPFLKEDRPGVQSSTYDLYAAEYAVLKRDVFGFQDDSMDTQGWDRKNVRQLAIAANNFSDFYDLRDAMYLMKTAEGEPHGTTIQNLLASRLSKKSLLLYKILQRYESGFPIGFLQLLPKERYSLKAWRRAGIQLVNSGVYIQRHGKQRLYERLRYADCVMRTAGRNAFQDRICREIDDIPYQSIYGYLYPFHKVEIERSQEIGDQEIEAHFTTMLRTLYDILQNKSEEYQQIHSLLQTELPSIVSMMRILPDEKLDWKPGLLYHLLKESRMSVSGEDALVYCDSLEQGCKGLGSPDGEGPRWRLFGEELMLYQSKALIRSQSSKEEGQQAAVRECERVENTILDAESARTLWEGEIPGQIFEHRVYAYFLRSMIYGRMSTIREIWRCQEKRAECAEQASYLEKMKDSLDSAERLIKERERVMGEKYGRLWGGLARLRGEYYFKMSQYYGEGRRYAGKDRWDVEEGCYQSSEEAYASALRYYDHNPDRYSIQRADILRNMADMYCQWARSVTEVSAEGRSTGKKREELLEQCYEDLIDAYVIYRRHFDIHGVADVLQSMGQVEGHNIAKDKAKEDGQRRRSRLCYYKASMDMYRHLGDEWSVYVVSNFLRYPDS